MSAATRTHARVVVIGGGIYGCSLLYHLVELGWREVMLIERGELTSGSTWHAAGMCTHYGHHPSVMRMRQHSARLYQRLERELGLPTGFRRCGALRLTRLPERMDEFRRVVGVGRLVDNELHVIGPRAIGELVPLMHTRELLGAIYEPNDGYCDPSQTTQALAKVARDGGAVVQRNDAVTAIERTAAGEWCVRTASGLEVTAEHVVDAAGFRAREVGAMVGLDLPIVPMLHQYLVTEDVPAVAALERPLPMVRDHDRSWYVRRERSGLLLGAYERDGLVFGVDGVDPAFGMELLPADLDRVEPIVADAMERMPVLAEAGIKLVVNGPITFTPDTNPLLGPAFGLDRFWLACGSSMGINEGGGAGRFLAEWIVGGEPPLDLLFTDPRRFGPWADRGYRVARCVESFAEQFGVHFPREERPAGRPLRTTPAYARQREQGAVFGTVNGIERANWFAAPGEPRVETPSFRRSNAFAAVAAEVQALAGGVGIMDLSAFTGLRVQGEDAEAFLDHIAATRLPRAVGGIALMHCLNTRGGVQCEFTVTRLAEHAFHLVYGAAAERHHLDWLRSHVAPAARVLLQPCGAARGVLAIAGPRARELLARVCEQDAGNAALPWLHAREMTVAGAQALVLRVSYVGELGYELHHDLAQQARLYDALKAAGADLGIRDVGIYAVDSMRIEKGYRAWGADLGPELGAIASGVGRFMRPDKGAFIGREALLAERPALRSVTIALDHAGQAVADIADAFGNEPVLAGGRIVGQTTSGGYGHRVGASLALALVDAALATPGTRLAVLLLGCEVPALVIAEPAWDSANARLLA